MEKDKKPITKNLIKISDWEKYVEYPTYATIKMISYYRKHNGADKFIFPIGKRLHISLFDFFIWWKSHPQIGMGSKYEKHKAQKRLTTFLKKKNQKKIQKAESLQKPKMHKLVEKSKDIEDKLMYLEDFERVFPELDVDFMYKVFNNRKENSFEKAFFKLDDRALVYPEMFFRIFKEKILR